MLLMVKKGIRGGICHPIHIYAKANDKYMKNYNTIKSNNLYGWTMSQKLPVNGFKRVEDISKLNQKL